MYLSMLGMLYILNIFLKANLAHTPAVGYRIYAIFLTVSFAHVIARGFRLFIKSFYPITQYMKKQQRQVERINLPLLLYG